MSTHQSRSAPTDGDLEDTVELPNLPEAESHTDTWVAPVFANPTPTPTPTPTPAPAGAEVPNLAPDGTTVEVVRAQLAEIGALRSDLTTASANHSRLETNLLYLTSTLSDLQTQLQARSAQIQRLEGEAETRERRLVELQGHLATRDEHLQKEASERATLTSRLEALQGELQRLTALREQQDQVRGTLESERTDRAAALTRAHVELSEFRRRSAAHGEALQHMEGRRHVFDTMLREREQLLDERDARLGTLESELRSLRQQTDTRQGEHGAALRQAQEQLAQREQALEQARAALQAQSDRAASDARASEEAHAATLRTITQQHAESLRAAQQQLSGAQARVGELEREVLDHAEALRTVNEQLHEAQLARDSAREDLAAAEELLRSSEGEQHQHGAQVSRLEHEATALRAQLGQVNQALDERNALLARFETQVANSAAGLGSQSAVPEPLAGDPSAHVATEVFSATGDHGTGASGSLTALDARARLLVRTDGDNGIVHVIGRRTTIGRTPDNDLRIEADFISRHHAVVLTSAHGTIVEDLNSTNGVFVNGTRVARRQLQDGDLLTIGRTGFRFVIKPAADA